MDTAFFTEPTSTKAFHAHKNRNDIWTKYPQINSKANARQKHVQPHTCSGCEVT